MRNAYAQHPVNREREGLIAEHVDMARRIAARVARRTPDWVQKDDLVGAAMIGLTEAADRYDASRQEPFVAFAERRIRGAVIDELRRGDLMSRRARRAAREISVLVRRLEHSLGQAPEDQEIADALGVTLEHYQNELEMLSHVSVVDVDSIATLVDSANESAPSAGIERAQLAKQLYECLGKLKERDAQVLSLYYVEELSYAEIGELLSVSESRVCQLHGRALMQLRAQMGHEEES